MKLCMPLSKKKLGAAGAQLFTRVPPRLLLAGLVVLLLGLAGEPAAGEEYCWGRGAPEECG